MAEKPQRPGPDGAGLRLNESSLMTLNELLVGTPTSVIEFALLAIAPEDADLMPRYRGVLSQLRATEPRPHRMRISVEPDRLPADPENPPLQVVGRDGTLNKQLPDWADCDAPSEYDNEEAVFSLSFQPWENWLGMEIEEQTLGQMPAADVLAHVVRDMTFYGFSQEVVAKALGQIRRALEAPLPEGEAIIPAVQNFPSSLDGKAP